jgi:hypothetical protein
MQDLNPTAHITGGAVRDVLLDRPIRDIDIFLAANAMAEAARLLHSKFGYVQVGEWQQYEHFFDPVIAGAAEFEKADEAIPVSLIGLNNHEDMRANIARFDFGVCMAGWDGRDVYRPMPFDREATNQTFTLLRADNRHQFAHSMVRFGKLTKERYAGWQLVVPEKFEALAREHSFRRDWYRETDDRLGFSGPNILRPKTR